MHAPDQLVAAGKERSLAGAKMDLTRQHQYWANIRAKAELISL